MRFSKYNQPRRQTSGRKTAIATKAAHQVTTQVEREKSRAAFDTFERASVGAFNGFEFAAEFHANYDKRDALEVLIADDCADVVTSAGAKLHTGADGIIAYIMTAAAQHGDVSKSVGFNRSIYIF